MVVSKGDERDWRPATMDVTTLFSSGIGAGLPWGKIVVTGLVIYVVLKIVKLLDGLRMVAYIPGIRCAFDPLDFPGAVIPTNWWNPGVDLIWWRRLDLYQKYKADTISIVPFIAGHPQLFSANLDVARQVVGSGIKSSWVKPERVSKALLLWGVNLAAAEKDVWRRHRRIMGPAFNSKLYNMVWQKTLATYHDWIAEEGWAKKDVIEVPRTQQYTFKLALLVISACGFGVPFSWTEPPTSIRPDGTETMSVQEALRLVSETVMWATLMPRWCRYLPLKQIQQMKMAHRELESFMLSQIQERKVELSGQLAGSKTQRDDVFSLLIRANELEAAQEGGSKQPTLSDQELLANVYVLLFAGHETTAHTLAATLGLLSVHPDIQQEVVDQIIDVLGYDRDPTFDEYDKLDRVTGAFYEALRLFPSGALMIREASEDTVLHVPNPPGIEGERVVVMPKGAQVTIDMVGVQYNSRYFPNPSEYLPSRWYNVNGSQDSDAFTAFSIGPRACIGRKFATVEAVCFLTMLLREWRVEPLLAPNETVEGWKERVLQASLIFTLSIRDVPDGLELHYQAFKLRDLGVRVVSYCVRLRPLK